MTDKVEPSLPAWLRHISRRQLDELGRRTRNVLVAQAVGREQARRDAVPEPPVPDSQLDLFEQNL